MYLCIVNMRTSCRYIHESKKPELGYNHPLQKHMPKEEIIDKSMKIPLNCCAIFFYSPPYLKARRLRGLVCCGVVCSFGGFKESLLHSCRVAVAFLCIRWRLRRLF